MRTFAALLIAACLVHSSFAFEAETCLGAPSTKCSAVSTLQIEVTQGKCSGTSRANCKTWAQSESVFQEAYSEWWSEGDKICDSNTVTAAANAVATAIAQVWTSAAVDVDCSEGVGFACGWSFANGETFGTAVAEAVAQAAADASLALEESGDEDGAAAADAFCFADVRAIAGGMAQAASDAAADACAGSGITASDYSDSFASAIEKVVADAFASATAGVCATEDGADVTAESRCDGTGEVTGETIVGGAGEFCTGTKKVPLCSGIVEEKCCTDKPRRSCRISRKDCKKCKSPFMRTKKGEATIFTSGDGTPCLCDVI